MPTTEEILKAAEEHLGRLGKWDVEKASLSIIRQAMISDDAGSTNEDDDMLEIYKRASVTERDMLDEFLTRICGYSYPTILHAMVTGKDLADASMDRDDDERRRALKRAARRIDPDGNL